MLIGDNLPELGTDLVAALASLDVDDLAHACELLASSLGFERKRGVPTDTQPP